MDALTRRASCRRKDAHRRKIFVRVTRPQHALVAVDVMNVIDPIGSLLHEGEVMIKFRGETSHEVSETIRPNAKQVHRMAKNSSQSRLCRIRFV